MGFSLRNSTPAQTPTTQLVKALINFGLDQPVAGSSAADVAPVNEGEAEGGDGDFEAEEDISVGGVKPQGAKQPDHQQTASDSSAKGKSKAAEVVGHALSKVSLSSAPAPAAAAVPRQLKSLLRSSEHVITIDTADGPKERTLTSWKMADYAYKREPCPFPTRARGLFTEAIEHPIDGDEYRIIARGYDKFFNVGEVSWTQWDAIPKHSSAPYELTQKSNGCIIFIAALSPAHILVTSKHSLGANAAASTEGSVSHSQRGEFWLERHLEKVGKTKEQLAAELWVKGLTAVAELCDDAFEEHVLAYPPELTGLHLHGLNRNLPTLVSLPSSEVTEFANKWGMIPTPYDIFPSILAVKTYCSNVEAQGGVEDPATGKITPVEGFVVRGVKKGGQPGEPFLWKVKYDQPYLMYREWRELTRKLLKDFPEVNVKPGKLKNAESRLYLWWVEREIRKDREAFRSWDQGKGIIKTREEFLSWSRTAEGKEQARRMGQATEEDEGADNRPFDKTLIVPVAVQGCGKTALALELAHLFNWQHTQSDDFLMKKPGPHFIKSVKTLLSQNDVVIADKNNHQRKLRADLISTASSLSPSHRVRVVGLVWDLDSLPRDKLHALLAERIVKRGQNHQSLRAGEGHEGAIWQFFGQLEKFDAATNGEDGKFDAVIELDPSWDQSTMLDHAVHELSKIVQLPQPSAEEKQKAIAHAHAYVPKSRKDVAPEKLAKLTAPRYYGIAVDADLKAILEPVLPDEAKAKGSVWASLVAEDRVEKNAHVTLVHELELKSEDLDFRTVKQALWDRYSALVTKSTTADAVPGELEVEVSLGPRIVWDSRAMSIEVSALHPKLGQVDEWLVEGRAAHITVGCAEGVRPFEGKGILEAVLRGEDEGAAGGGKIGVSSMAVVKCRGKLAGLR